MHGQDKPTVALNTPVDAKLTAAPGHDHPTARADFVGCAGSKAWDEDAEAAPKAGGSTLPVAAVMVLATTAITVYAYFT